MIDVRSFFRAKHFAVLLEHEREWLEFLVAAMAWRARSCERDAQIMATDTIVMTLKMRVELCRN
jgi:hypothetical protein